MMSYGVRITEHQVPIISSGFELYGGLGYDIVAVLRTGTTGNEAAKEEEEEEENNFACRPSALER